MKEKRSLVQFLRDKKRANCPVCQLPLEIRTQIGEARAKKISRADILDWLKSELGLDLEVAAIDAHKAGRHDA